MKTRSKSFIFPEDQNKDNTPKARSGPNINLFSILLNPDENYIRSLKSFQTKSYSVNPLAAHFIPALHRQKIIEWVLEASLKFSSIHTFCSSVKIMDQFLTATSISLSPGHLQLIAASCLFIASKLHDQIPIRLRVLTNKICSNRFSIDQVTRMEEVILMTLEFNVNFVDVLTFFEFISWKVRCDVRTYNSCIALILALQMNYEMLKYFDEEIAVACLKLALDQGDKVGIEGGNRMVFDEFVENVGVERIKCICDEIIGFCGTLDIRGVDINRILLLLKNKLGVKCKFLFLE